MAICKIAMLLDRYARDFMILDYNHLFVSGSLREEVWLLRQTDDQALVAEILLSAREFGIHDAAAERNFTTYSGGQQAILSCLLVMAVVRATGVRDVKLLLNNVMDSVSGENRRRLQNLFDGMATSHGLRLFAAFNDKVREIG